MKRKGTTPPREWGPWNEVTHGTNRLTGEKVPVDPRQRLVGNNLYNVLMTPLEPADDSTPPMVWLSICRKDRKVIRDWRHLQRIKSELVGPECEAVEVFPAESRMVDQANQFHLWVFADPAFRLPFGFNEGRVVLTPEEATADAPGAVQRALDDDGHGGPQ